jgi:hypothetical protein
MSKNQKKTKKTYDPSLRWDVVEIDHNEQEPGGEFGKRRVVSAKPLRRERAENLLARCAEHQASMNEIGCKSHRTFVLVEAV